MYQPNKAQLVALASEAGSFATRTSAALNMATVSSLFLTVVLANKAGTVTFTPKIQRKLKDGTWVDYWTAASALSANGTTTYAIGRDAIEALTALTEVITDPVPHTIRVVLTYSGAGDGNEFDTYAELECFPW